MFACRHCSKAFPKYHGRAVHMARAHSGVTAEKKNPVKSAAGKLGAEARWNGEAHRSVGRPRQRGSRVSVAYDNVSLQAIECRKQARTLEKKASKLEAIAARLRKV